MATRSSFEERNRERRRRERLRKKRIRTAISLIAAAGVIALVCVCVSVVSNNRNEAENYAAAPQEQVQNIQGLAQGQAQSIQGTAPTEGTTIITGSIDGKVTGSTTVNMQAASVQSAPTWDMTIPQASEENNLMQIIEDSGQTKRCYLTFDDGPTKNITPQILDTLRKYNVKATFFQVGSLIKANPDMARRVYEEGHLIANHSQNHEYAELYDSSEAFMTEISECYETIKSITDGEEPFKLVRFPGGGFNSSADRYSSVKQKSKEALKEAGFYFCDWNTLNGDAEGKTKNADELLEYLKDYSEGYDNLVVLMHDAAAKQATANYLASAIEWLISEGYTFHRLDDIEYQVAPAPTEEVVQTTEDIQ